MQGLHHRPLSFSLLLGLLSVSSLMAAEHTLEVTPLEAGVDKVLYVPIQGSSPEVTRIREKELAATERFLVARGVVQQLSLTSVHAPEVFLQVEPALMMALHSEACSGDEATRPAQTLAGAQARLLAGDAQGAREALEEVQAQLPCAQSSLTRAQMAEFFLWSGLCHRDWPSAPALTLLRTGLSIDPTLVDNPRIPAERIDQVRSSASELELESGRVDMHMPQDEGALWSLKNLVLDGRRLVFEKLFVPLNPGLHFLQVSLPNEKTWGTFIEVEAGTTPDLATLARARFGVRARYLQEVGRLLSEGYVSPGLSDGLRLYSTLIRRDLLTFSAITQEDDGSWITVRTWSATQGVSVPDLSRFDETSPLTASVPLVLSQPWSVDSGLSVSGLRGLASDYRAPGLGLVLEGHRLLPNDLRAGLSVGLGLRSFFLAESNAEDRTVADLDVDLGASFGLAFHLPLGLQLLPDLGYRAHLNPLRGLPVYCSGAEVNVAPEQPLSFECAPEYADESGSYRFNLRALAHGPRVRAALELPPISRGLFFLRGQVRLAYGPLIAALPETATIAVYTQSATGNAESAATLSIDPSARLLWLHQLDVIVGINGIY